MDIINSLKFILDKSGRSIMIYINIIIYIILKILYLFCFLLGKIEWVYTIESKLSVPLYYKYALEQPWSIIIYSFVNNNLLYLLVSLMAIKIFGKIIEQHVSKQYLYKCYLGSSIVPVLLLIAVYNIFPQLQREVFIVDITGSYGACLGLIFASIKLIPSYKFNYLVFKNVGVKTVGIILLILYLFLNNFRLEYIILGFFSAIYGYLFIAHLQSR